MRLRPVISSLLIFILLALFAPDARAQTVLGKSPADKFAAAFWAQNTNADAVVSGLNGFGHGMLTNALLFPYVGGANITITPNPDGTISISGTGGGGGGGTPIGAGSNLVITVIGGSNYLGVVPRFTNSLQAAIVKTNIANGSQLFQDWTIFPNGSFDSISYVPHAATYSGTWWAGGFNAGAAVPGYTGDGSALTGIPVTALSLAGAVNGNVPTVVGGVWGLGTPSGSGLALTDTNAFATGVKAQAAANTTTATNNLLVAAMGYLTNQTLAGLGSHAARGATALVIPKLVYTNGATRLLVIGDSTMEPGIGNSRGDTIPGALIKMVKAQYGNAGSGYPPLQGGTPGSYVYSGRPENNYMGDSICLYQSDGDQTFYRQPADPNAVVCTSITFYWVANTNGGLAPILISSSLGGWSVTNLVDGHASSPGIRSTNWTVAASTDIAIGVKGMLGTNIFLTAEFAKSTNSPGLIEYYYSWGGTTPLQMLAVGSNQLAALFAAIKPDLVLFQSKHQGIDTWANSYSQTMQILAAARAATATNTAVVGILTYPRTDTDTYPLNADATLNNSVTLAVCQASNYPVADLYSGYPNPTANNLAGLYFDGIHPNFQGSRVWAADLYNQLGFAQPPFGTTAGAGGTNNVTGFTGVLNLLAPAALTARVTVSNGLVQTNMAFTLPAGATIWHDANQGLALAGTNLSAWTNQGSASGYYLHGTADANTAVATNFQNGLPVVRMSGNSALAASGVSRDWFVDTTNHTDQTMVIAMVATNTGGLWSQIFNWSDGASDYNAFGLGDTALYAGVPTLVYDLGAQSLTTPATLTNFCLVRFWRSGTNMQIAVNGKVVAWKVASGNPNAGSGTLTMGYFDGLWIGEVSIWPRALGTNELANFESYLGFKWGVAQPVNLAGTFAGTHTGDGSGLTNLNVASGTTGYSGTVNALTPAAAPIALTFAQGVLQSNVLSAYTVPTGATMWYDANKGVAMSGTNLSQWTNQGSSTITFTGTPDNNTALATNTQNSLATMYFNNNSALAANGASRDWYVDATAHTDETFLFALNVRGTSGWNSLFRSVDSGSQVNDFHFGDGAPGVTSIIWYQGNNVLVVPYVPLTNFAVVRFWRSGTNMQCWVNGMLAGATNATGSVNALSGSMNLGFLDAVNLGEAINWPRALTATELQNAESYLGTKWNVGQPLNMSGTFTGTFYGNAAGLTNLPGGSGTDATKAPTNNPVVWTPLFVNGLTVTNAGVTNAYQIVYTNNNGSWFGVTTNGNIHGSNALNQGNYQLTNGGGHLSGTFYVDGPAWITNFNNSINASNFSCGNVTNAGIGPNKLASTDGNSVLQGATITAPLLFSGNALSISLASAGASGAMSASQYNQLATNTPTLSGNPIFSALTATNATFYSSGQPAIVLYGGWSTTNLTTLNWGMFTNGNYTAGPSGSTTVTINGASGAITATTFSGNGASLTNYTPDINSPQLPRTLWRDGLVSNSGTSETAISTNTLPANLLAVNGNSIDYWICGTNANASARTITWKVYYGSSSVVAQTTSTTTGIAWELHVQVVRVAASVVDVYTSAQASGVIFNVLRVTDTGSTASAQPLSVTITSTSASGDVNCRWGRAQFVP